MKLLEPSEGIGMDKLQLVEKCQIGNPKNA